MSEIRKIAAILVADIVGYSRLVRADEERTLARLRALRSDLIEPAIAVHRGRIVKGTGDGFIAEFRSVVDAARSAVEVQTGMIERNAGVAAEKRIEFRIGAHLGDVVEEADGDLMGDGVNIAARLEGVCAAGAISMSEDFYRQLKGRLDVAITELGLTELKNIPELIRVYLLDVGRPAEAKSAPPPTPQMPTPTPEKPGPPHLSIVVLPFANIGADPEQEHFVDGVTESLTTDLSRIRSAVVIARNTAFTYKGKPFDVKTIGRDLNVRYVLEGSVQRSGNRMRVNVQLVDAESGSHLWAERFDKPLADLFDMQDEIVGRLANALSDQLAAVEAHRAEKAPNPDSMDLFFQGLSWIHRGRTPNHVAQARGFLERALAADPDNINALVSLAGADIADGGNSFVVDPAAAFAAAEAKLTRALSSFPDHARGHAFLGYVKILTKRAVEGIAECEHALVLDRNLADAHAFIGLGKIFSGRAKEAEAHIEQALRLSPRDMSAYLWLTEVGVAKNHLGDYEQAVLWCRRAIEANRNYPEAYFHLAAALARLGRVDEARSAISAGLALNPSFTVSRARVNWTAMSDHPIHPVQLAPIFEGLRMAGLPE
jgi:TolB-like protein/class 3 adenylate cyclase